MEVASLIVVSKAIKAPAGRAAAADTDPAPAISRRIACEYLTLSRETDTLSGGESAAREIVNPSLQQPRRRDVFFDEPSVACTRAISSPQLTAANNCSSAQYLFSMSTRSRCH